MSDKTSRTRVTFDERGAHITLPTGEIVTFDPEDAGVVQRHWWARKKTANTYAMTSVPTESGRRRTVYMHRLLIDAPKGKLVDHRDGNSLNNSRSNLRLATAQDNQRNKRARKGTSSAYKGVWLHVPSQRWRACIQVDHEHKHLGYFDDEVAAASAYDAAASHYFGEFARLNFPHPAEHDAALANADSSAGQRIRLNGQPTN